MYHRVSPETLKGLKRACYYHIFALSDARELSFFPVLCLEREEKISDQSNFVNVVT